MLIAVLQYISCGGSGRPVALHISWIGLFASTYSVPDTWIAAQSTSRAPD